MYVPQFDPERETAHPAELLCSVAESITDRWLADADYVGEYSTVLTDAEYHAISIAVASMDGQMVLRKYRVALRRAMRMDALREALDEIERERRESEDEFVESLGSET
jgi:hypothetical protein